MQKKTEVSEVSRLDTSVLLKTYLELEKTMLYLDEMKNEKYGELLREVMDVLWWDLSEKEREFLNNQEWEMGSNDKT